MFAGFHSGLVTEMNPELNRRSSGTAILSIYGHFSRPKQGISGLSPSRQAGCGVSIQS